MSVSVRQPANPPDALRFNEIVGLDVAKQALLFLAVDPSLAGVALAAATGSGKSTLARAFAALLPDNAPFVELPLNVTEDRLIGGLDLEATLARGERVVEPGLLARAHGGVLYIDGLNLLDPGVAAHVMDAMARGIVQLERDGVSAVHPARFRLIGTFDPGDGAVTGSLLDRIGLIIPFAPQGDAAVRAEVVRRNLRRADMPDAAGDDAMLRALIELAREQLPHVAIRDEQVDALARAALSLGVEGNRVDVFAVKAALASAALAGRADVGDADLEIAARLVLLPRATRSPEPTQVEQQAQPAPNAAPNPDRPAADDPASSPADQKQTPQQIEELLMSAVEADLPADLSNLPFAAQRRGRTGSRGVALNYRRGRFVRAIPGPLRGRRIALLPTLLSAAPWQSLRTASASGSTGSPHRAASTSDSTSSPPRSASTSSAAGAVVRITRDDIRVRQFRDKAGALFVFVVDASGSMALNRMREAKGATIRLLQNAYVHRDQVSLIAFRGQAAQVLLPPSQSVDRAKRELDVLPTGGGTPLASALLLAWQIVRQARSRGVEQATLVLMTDGRANVALGSGQAGPTGASTSSAAGGPLPELVEGNGVRSASTGSADVAAGADREQIARQIRHLAHRIACDRINAVVIDTQAGYLSRGEARALAGYLNGRYVYLPNAKAHQIAEVI